MMVHDASFGYPENSSACRRRVAVPQMRRFPLRSFAVRSLSWCFPILMRVTIPCSTLASAKKDSRKRTRWGREDHLRGPMFFQNLRWLMGSIILDTHAIWACQCASCIPTYILVGISKLWDIMSVKQSGSHQEK